MHSYHWVIKEKASHFSVLVALLVCSKVLVVAIRHRSSLCGNFITGYPLGTYKGRPIAAKLIYLPELTPSDIHRSSFSFLPRRRFLCNVYVGMCIQVRT